MKKTIYLNLNGVEWRGVDCGEGWSLNKQKQTSSSSGQNQKSSFTNRRFAGSSFELSNRFNPLAEDANEPSADDIFIPNDVAINNVSNESYIKTSESEWSRRMRGLSCVIQRINKNKRYCEIDDDLLKELIEVTGELIDLENESRKSGTCRQEKEYIQEISQVTEALSSHRDNHPLNVQESGKYSVWERKKEKRSGKQENGQTKRDRFSTSSGDKRNSRDFRREAWREEESRDRWRGHYKSHNREGEFRGREFGRRGSPDGRKRDSGDNRRNHGDSEENSWGTTSPGGQHEETGGDSLRGRRTATFGDLGDRSCGSMDLMSILINSELYCSQKARGSRRRKVSNNCVTFSDDITNTTNMTKKAKITKDPKEDNVEEVVTLDDDGEKETNLAMSMASQLQRAIVPDGDGQIQGISNLDEKLKEVAEVEATAGKKKSSEKKKNSPSAGLTGLFSLKVTGQNNNKTAASVGTGDGAGSGAGANDAEKQTTSGAVALSVKEANKNAAPKKPPNVTQARIVDDENKDGKTGGQLINKPVKQVAEGDQRPSYATVLKSPPNSVLRSQTVKSPSTWGLRKDLVAKTAHDESKGTGRGGSKAQSQLRAPPPGFTDQPLGNQQAQAQPQAQGRPVPDFSGFPGLSTVEKMNEKILDLPELPATPSNPGMAILRNPPTTPMTPITSVESPKSGISGSITPGRVTPKSQFAVDPDLIKAHSTAKKPRSKLTPALKEVGRGRGRGVPVSSVGRGRGKIKNKVDKEKSCNVNPYYKPAQKSMTEYVNVSPRVNKSPASAQIATAAAAVAADCAVTAKSAADAAASAAGIAINETPSAQWPPVRVHRSMLNETMVEDGSEAGAERRKFLEEEWFKEDKTQDEDVVVVTTEENDNQMMEDRAAENARRVEEEARQNRDKVRPEKEKNQRIQELSEEDSQSRAGSPKRKRDIESDVVSESKKCETDAESSDVKTTDDEDEDDSKTLKPGTLDERFKEVGEREDSWPKGDDEVFEPIMTDEVRQMDEEEKLRKKKEELDLQVLAMNSALAEQMQEKYDMEEELQRVKDENKALNLALETTLREQQAGKEVKKSQEVITQTSQDAANWRTQEEYEEMHRLMEEMRVKDKQREENEKRMAEEWKGMAGKNEGMAREMNKLKLAVETQQQLIDHQNEQAKKNEEIYKKMEEASRAQMVNVQEQTRQIRELTSEKEILKSKIPCPNPDGKSCKEKNGCVRSHGEWKRVEKETGARSKTQDGGRQEETARIICHYFMSKRGCNKGDSCKFKHPDIEIRRRGGSRERRPESRGRRASPRRSSRSSRDSRTRTSSSYRRSPSRSSRSNRSRRSSPSSSSRARSSRRGSDKDNWRHRDSSSSTNYRGWDRHPYRDSSPNGWDREEAERARDIRDVNPVYKNLPKLSEAMTAEDVRMRMPIKASGNEKGSERRGQALSQTPLTSRLRAAAGGDGGAGRGTEGGAQGGARGVEEVRGGKSGSSGGNGTVRMDHKELKEAKEKRSTKEKHLKETEKASKDPVFDALVKSIIQRARETIEEKRKQREDEEVMDTEEDTI